MASKVINFNILNRFFHQTAINYGINKTFRKVLGTNNSKKRKYVNQDVPIFQEPIKLERSISAKKRISRRSSMLNKVFMRYVSDSMVNGEHWEEYEKLGIEISAIEISPDYKRLNIFWVTKLVGMDDVIDKFLEERGYKIRHELSQLQVIGVIPPIYFIKDKKEFQLLDLDRKMQIADFGEDYEPVAATRLKQQLHLYRPLDENIKKQLENIEDIREEEEEDVIDDIPEMSQNVLGLDYNEIMNRVQKQMKTKESRPPMWHAQVPESIDENDEVFTREQFQLYLRKRQLQLQNKKKDKNFSIDVEYMKEELRERFSQEHYNNIENNLDQFGDDYIEEEDTK